MTNRAGARGLSRKRDTTGRVEGRSRSARLLLLLSSTLVLSISPCALPAWLSSCLRPDEPMTSANPDTHLLGFAAPHAHPGGRA